MPSRIHLLIAATSLACLTAWSIPFASADPTPAPADVNQFASQQRSVRNQTQRATGELDALIVEFDRNGLGDGADVQILKNIRGVLATLSQKDMEKVITLLESARKGDAHSITRALADAFSGQQGISSQLHQLLIEYQREQDLAELALRLTRLADTENQNMKAGTALFRSTKGAPIAANNDVERAQLQVQQSQQQAIYEEAKVLLDRLAKLGETADPTTAERIKAVVAEAEKQKIAPALKNAAEDLKSAHLLSAVGKERASRDTLRDLARLVAPSKDPTAALKDAADQLAQDIREQNFVAQQAKAVTAPDKDEVDTVAKLDDQQADIVDSADGVKKDIANLTPEAVPDLKAAHDQMQDARKSLAEGKGKEAAQKADAASQQLTQARQKLLSEIARLDDAAKADTKIAAAKALKEQIIALRKREEQLQSDTGAAHESKALADMAPRQSTLTDALHELQKAAATDFAPVAAVLSDAGKGMDQAQDALATRQNGPEAVKSEQVAVDDLKKAEAMLDEQIAKLEATKQDLAKLQKAREKVAKAVDEQTKVELDTNKLAQKNKPDAAVPKPKDLAPKQDQVAQDAKDAAKDIADTAPDAAKPLDNAAKNADQAKAALDNADPKAADPKAKDALKDLQNGLAALDKKIAQDKQDLGQPDDTAQKLADADKAVDQAMNDLDAPDDPVAQIKQKQQDIANDLKTMPANQPDVAKAQQAADDAAKQLANNDLPKAAESMQKAEEAMQKAMDAGKPDAGKPDAGKPDAGKPDAGKPDAGKLPELAQKQADLQKQLAAVQAGETPPTPDDVAADLSKADADAGGALPDDAKAGMAEAQSKSSDAGAEQAAGKSPAGSKAAAKAALQKAKASIAMAQAGLGGQPMGQGNEPGQGPPMAGKGGPPGPGKEDPNSKGTGDRKDANVGNDSRTGGHAGAGQSAYVGLPPRDREAIQQSRGEKYPSEYGPMIEQYLKNLSDQTSK